MKKKKQQQQQRRTSTNKKKNKGGRNKSSTNSSTTTASALASTSLPIDETETSLSLLSLAPTPSPPPTPYVQDGIKYKSKFNADCARFMKTCIARHNKNLNDMNDSKNNKESSCSVDNNKSNSNNDNNNDNNLAPTNQATTRIENTTPCSYNITSTVPSTLLDIPTTSPKQPKCYHGSSKEAYTNPKYIEAFSTIFEPHVFVQDYKNRRLMKDIQFCNYTFARAVDMWFQYNFHLESPLGKKDDVFDEVGASMLVMLLITALNSRYKSIPQSKGMIFDSSLQSPQQLQLTKYIRDLQTYRGTANILSRETLPNNGSSCGCTCMYKSKQKAKKLEKIGLCIGCGENFPKNQLRLCIQCNVARYCSRKCQIANWPDHKPTCQGMLKQVQWGTKAHENVWKEISGVL